MPRCTVLPMFWFFLVVGSLGASSSARALPTFDFSEPQVTIVHAVTPGGSVALYGLLHESGGWSLRISEIADLVTDDDGDGSVRYELGREVSTVSVWLAVDLVTGDMAISAPEGFTPRELTFPPGVLRSGLGNRLNRLEMTGRTVHALMARPGADPTLTGAWLLRLGDGGDQDDDGAYDGKMGFLLAQMTPVGASPLPPEEIVLGDVIALIDPDTLDFVVATFAVPGSN